MQQMAENSQNLSEVGAWAEHFGGASDVSVKHDCNLPWGESYVYNIIIIIESPLLAVTSFLHQQQPGCNANCGSEQTLCRCTCCLNVSNCMYIILC